MEIDFQVKGRWLARHVLPYEPMLRSRLRRMFLHGMEVDEQVVLHPYTTRTQDFVSSKHARIRADSAEICSR
jgi:hypothetical protein